MLYGVDFHISVIAVLPVLSRERTRSSSMNPSLLFAARKSRCVRLERMMIMDMCCTYLIARNSTP